VPSLVVSPGAGHAPTVLYLHGGGYVVGSAFGYQSQAGALAAPAQTGILVPDYRLAPEHPFPAGVEDARRAGMWLREQAANPDGVVVAGDTAGGGLLLSLLLTLKRDGEPLPAAAVILCPWLDLTETTPVGL
jgi:epsilon-lactone hydrolase